MATWFDKKKVQAITSLVCQSASISRDNWI